MARVKYFDFNYLLPFYNLQRYTLQVSGLVDSLCTATAMIQKDGKPWKIHTYFHDIFNYPNWDF